MSDALVPAGRAAPMPYQQNIFMLTPKAMVERATEIADVLKDVIDKQGLSVRIGPNNHVKAEGWATLGTLLGILPRERSVVEMPNGDFEAFVELVRQADGVVVGGASALCSVEEARWAKAERYARRSMAITRATGKAYRLCFAWVVSLAGYSGTPYEEMPDEPRQEKQTRPAPAKPTAAKDDDGAFDPKNDIHVRELRAALKERKITDASTVAAITAKMAGKYPEDLAAVIVDVNAAAHVDQELPF